MSNRATRLLVLALVVLVPVSAFAQQPSAASLGVGVKAAPLFASLDQGPANWVNRKGVVGGVAFDVARHSRVALIAEALYVRKGAANLGSRAYLNMLELPVLVRVNVAGSALKATSVYGLVGQALDVNLRTAQQKVSQINLVDPNVVVGAGIEIKRVVFEARENIGLRTLAPNTPSLKARTFSMMVGFRFR